MSGCVRIKLKRDLVIDMWFVAELKIQLHICCLHLKIQTIH